jgi:hypothetical protein
MRKIKVNPHSKWEVLLERHMTVRAMSPKSIMAYIELLGHVVVKNLCNG